MKSMLCIAMLFAFIPSGAFATQPSPKSAERAAAKKMTSPAVENKEALKPGDTVPMFALKEFGGDFVLLKRYCGKSRKDAAVKAVLLDFFATDCLACVAGLDELQALAVKYAPGLRTFLISVDAKPEEVLPPFLKEKKMNLPVLIDMYRKTLSSYGFASVPQTVLIDGECKVVCVMKNGDKDVSAVRGHLEALTD